MALQTIGDLFISLFATYQGFYTYKGFTYSLHMNSLNIFVDFSNLHVFQGIKWSGAVCCVFPLHMGSEVIPV